MYSNCNANQWNANILGQQKVEIRRDFAKNPDNKNLFYSFHFTTQSNKTTNQSFFLNETKSSGVVKKRIAPNHPNFSNIGTCFFVRARNGPWIPICPIKAFVIEGDAERMGEVTPQHHFPPPTIDVTWLYRMLVLACVSPEYSAAKRKSIWNSDNRINGHCYVTSQLHASVQGWGCLLSRATWNNSRAGLKKQFQSLSYDRECNKLHVMFFHFTENKETKLRRSEWDSISLAVEISVFQFGWEKFWRGPYLMDTRTPVAP